MVDFFWCVVGVGNDYCGGVEFGDVVEFFGECYG